MADKVNVYEVITDRIIALLDKGVVPWRKGWSGGISTNGRMPRNIRGTAYRGINVFLLASQGYDSPFWLTYKQAVALGGKVMRGEKGTAVILWQPFEKDVFNEKKGKTERKRMMTLRYYTVFNVAQTEGCKFPKKVAASLVPSTEPVKVDEFAAIEAADAIFENWAGKPVVAYDGNDRAYYVPSTDIIHLPSKAQFRGSGEYYSTLFHEGGHATGHSTRLNRKQANAFGSHDYGVEELTAEFTAAYLNAVAGLEPEVIENNAAYIASWKATIKADPKLVITAAGAAQKAADLILGTAVKTEAVEDTSVNVEDAEAQAAA